MIIDNYAAQWSVVIFSGVGCESTSSVLLVEIVTLYAVDVIIVNDELSIVNLAKLHQVVIAAGSHLFPFRTEKLSPPAPMVLQCNAGE